MGYFCGNRRWYAASAVTIRADAGKRDIRIAHQGNLHVSARRNPDDDPPPTGSAMTQTPAVLAWPAVR
jgi:hypothetical protein